MFESTELEKTFKKILNSIAIVSSSLSLNDVLKKILKEICDLLQAEGASIFLVDQSKNIFSLKVASNIKDTLYEDITIPLGKGIISGALKNKKLINLQDAQTDPRFYEQVDKVTGIKTKSILAIPLLVDNNLIGAIEVINKKNNETFDDKDELIIQEFTYLASIAIQKAQLHNEILKKQELEIDLRIASNIQKKILPENDLKIGNLKFNGYYQPAKLVGGDYYDYYPLSNSKVFFTIGDVSGKGTQASLLVSSVKSFLFACLSNGFPLENTVNKLNKYFYKITPPNTFITLFLGILDYTELSIEYINAGHLLPIQVTPQGTIESTFKNGLLLGVVEDHEYKSYKIGYDSNNSLILFTDGIIEAQNEKMELLGIDCLLNIISGSKNDIDKLIEIIPEKVREHCGKIEQNDDITLLTISSI